MDNSEKFVRCFAAWKLARSEIPEYSLENPRCKVYTRRMTNCFDCSFSTETRPAYLRRKGVV